MTGQCDCNMTQCEEKHPRYVEEKCKEETKLEMMVYGAREVSELAFSVRNLAMRKAARVVGEDPECESCGERPEPCCDTEKLAYSMDNIRECLYVIQRELNKI